jgi:cytochrome c oxidase subunit 1
VSTPIVSSPDGFSLTSSHRGFIRWNIYFGFAALSIGVLNGIRQALNYAGTDILGRFTG